MGFLSVSESATPAVSDSVTIGGCSILISCVILLVDMDNLTHYFKCLACGKRWFPKNDKPPKSCPKCRARANRIKRYNAIEEE